MKFGQLKIENGILHCPRCQSDYLNFIEVISFNRLSEDSAQALKSTFTSLKVASEISDNSGNPSARRDGLVIRFACESCSNEDEGKIELAFAQHKGTTEMSWRYIVAD